MVHRHEAHWASYKASKRYKMFHHALANGNYYLCQKKRDALEII